MQIHNATHFTPVILLMRVNWDYLIYDHVVGYTRLLFRSHDLPINY